MKHSNQYHVISINWGDKYSTSLLTSLIEKGSLEGEEYLKGIGIKTDRRYVLSITVGWEWKEAL